jgi:hypothetical protein
MKTELIKTFISDIVNKDYKKASDSLSSVVEAQLAQRVKTALSQKKQTEKDK